MPRAVINSQANLFVPLSFHWRLVDTPEMATPISLKRLKNEARRDAVSNAGLDDIYRPQMTRQAPNRTHERGITIVPALEALWPNPNTLRL